MTMEQRCHLQLAIGTFIGAKTALDVAADKVPIEASVEHLRLGDSNKQEDWHYPRSLPWT